jgi:hypothetical protein
MGKTKAQIARKHGPAAAGIPLSPSDQPAPPRHNGNLILIPAVAAALFLFWYFHLLTLSQMTQLSAGLSMPDMLFGGYDATYIDRLRSAMDPAALGQLSYVHKTAGTLFPLLFGLAWLLLVQLNVSRRWLRWALWSPALLFVVVDLWENVAIDSALSASDAGAVALASALTVTRWVLFAASCAAGLLAVLLPRSVRSTAEENVS